MPSPPLPFPTASERCRGHAGVTHAVPDTASPLLRAKKDRLDLLFLPDESPEQERLCIIPYVAVFLLFSDELRRRFRRTEPSSSMLEHICRSTVSLRFFPLSSELDLELLARLTVVAVSRHRRPCHRRAHSYRSPRLSTSSCSASL